MPNSLILLKFEIVIFFLSSVYILYYIWWKVYRTYFKVRKVIIKEDIANTKVALNKLDLNTKEETYKKDRNKKKLTSDEMRQVSELLKRVRINSSKWYYDTARSLIVEWLAIDRFNIDLNLELANIYVKEKNYPNAEYVYKDLLEFAKWDLELYKNLAYTYFMQWKLEDAKDTYEKVHKKNSADENVINMLAEISYDLKDWKNSIKYINQYLKFKPRDIDKMTMKAISFEQLRSFKEAVEVHKKVLEFQPYNTFSRDKVRELSNMVV